MANRTDPHADTVHGGNPQFLVDRVVRVKIYNDAYWKEFCFGLTTESLIDRAAEIDYVGGTYGGRRRPAKFLCLLLKLLQIQPDEDVVMEYIKQSDLKYLRALGAAYLRMTARAKTVYTTLEPLFADYRKLRYRDMSGKLSIIHMDEVIDWLFREEHVFDVTLPSIPKREVMEITQDLEPRASVLEDDLEDLDDLVGGGGQDEKDGPADEADASPERTNSPAEAPQKASERGPEKASSQSPAPRSGSRRRSSSSGSRSRSRSRRRRSRERRSRERRSRGRRDRRRSRSASRPSSRSSSERSRRGKDDRRQKKEARTTKDAKETKEAKQAKASKEAKEAKEAKEVKEVKYERAKPKKEKWKLDKKDKKTGKEKKEKREDGGKGKKKDKDGLSVDGWNDVRAQLGLKPLKA